MVINRHRSLTFCLSNTPKSHWILSVYSNGPFFLSWFTAINIYEMNEHKWFRSTIYELSGTSKCDWEWSFEKTSSMDYENCIDLILKLRRVALGQLQYRCWKIEWGFNGLSIEYFISWKHAWSSIYSQLRRTLATRSFNRWPLAV